MCDEYQSVGIETRTEKGERSSEKIPRSQKEYPETIIAKMIKEKKN